MRTKTVITNQAYHRLKALTIFLGAISLVSVVVIALLAAKIYFQKAEIGDLMLQMGDKTVDLALADDSLRFERSRRESVEELVFWESAEGYRNKYDYVLLPTVEGSNEFYYRWTGYGGSQTFRRFSITKREQKPDGLYLVGLNATDTAILVLHNGDVAYCWRNWTHGDRPERFKRLDVPYESVSPGYEKYLSRK